jgi:hypothetical protein
MKNLSTVTLITVFLLTLFTSNNVKAEEPEIQECPMGSAETLVCEAVLCSVGLLIAESRPKCIQVTKKFTIYLATLGFWSKPPSCKQRDQNCNVTGKGTTASIDIDECGELDNEEDQNNCRAAAGEVTQEYCDTFTGADKLACEEEISG